MNQPVAGPDLNRSPGSGPSQAALPASSRRDLTTKRSAVRAVVGAVTAMATIVVVNAYRTEPAPAVLLAIVVLGLGLLSTIDLAEQRLPNRITLPLAGGTALVLLVDGVANGDVVASISALGVGFAFAIVLMILQFGMGDVKLALTVGMIAGSLGREAVMTTAYAAAVAGGVAAVTLMIIHRRRDVTFPFGPVLAVGSVAGMLVGAPVI